MMEARSRSDVLDTPTGSDRHRPSEYTPPARDAKGRLLLPLIVIAALAVLTFLLRAYELNRSFDIFIDEITYLRISQNIERHMQVTIYGTPFFLHPPAFLFIQAGYLKLLQPGDGLIHKIYTVRYLNLAFASISAGALFIIVRRVSGWGAGLVTGSIFALDPFIITMNSQDLLDTSGVCWILVGYVCLLTGPRRGENVLNVSPLRAVAAGLAFGLAFLTKDMTAFLSLLPLFGCWALGWSIRRRVTLLVGGVTVLVYLPYPIISAAVGQWHAFVAAKTQGLARLAGMLQMTGFNRSGGPSLLHSIVARLTTYGTTYALIALGVPGAYVLLRRARPADRLVVVWTGSAYALLTYCVFIGTLEEQFFYLLVVPALVATVSGGAVFFGPGRRWTRRRGMGVTICAALLIVFAGWSGVRWLVMHTRPNDGYAALSAFIKYHIPSQGRHIAALDQTGQFILAHHASGPFGSWDTVSAMRRYAPDYVLITPHEMQWDYGARAVPLQHWVLKHGKLVFAFYGQSNNRLLLYRLPWSPPSHAPVPSVHALTGSKAELGRDQRAVTQ
jgi:4-amino-4-deoxy-L-arabinose transferase-like glycosyltransferase